MVSTSHSLSHPGRAGGDWRLVGPWYRWEHPGLPMDGRGAAPAIQKFAGDDFIEGFLAHPQHSLKYDPVVDVVQTQDLVKVPGATLRSLILALNAKGQVATKADESVGLYRARIAPGSLRKLYQPTHDRHYLVTCELHCDAPGFPRVKRDQVCQAGFVVRRRRSVVPANITAADIEAHTAPVRSAEAELMELRQLDVAGVDPQSSAGLKLNVQARQAELAHKAGYANWATYLTAKAQAVANLRQGLNAWYEANKIAVKIDGWFPTLVNGRPSATFGQWRELSEAEQLADITSGEHHYPMFSLINDPRETTHDAAGRTMYYGLVPTTSLQHDQQAQARFDDLSTFEVRCFVRQHEPCPGRVGKLPDCHGELVWSRATEPFRVAAPFDVLGSSNRPITIKMPDLRELAAQAALRPKGRLSPVRFVQPQHLSTKIVDGQPQENDVGGEAICSFSIPLITIIALFVLNLFLPIVVFVFNLWFLLVFRFCIPPSIQLAAGLDAALAVTPPSIDLEAQFSVKVNGVDVLVKPGDLHELLTNGAGGIGTMEQRILDDTGMDKKPHLEGMGNNAIGPIDQSLQDAAARTPNAASPMSSVPPVGEPLVYEDPVTPVWSLSGAKA
jgi:hypothetical protein